MTSEKHKRKNKAAKKPAKPSKSTGRRPGRPRKPAPAPAALPEAMDAAPVQTAATPEPPQPQSLREKVTALFQAKETNRPLNQPEPSQDSSKNTFGDALNSLPPESVALLGGIPETVEEKPQDSPVDASTGHPGAAMGTENEVLDVDPLSAIMLSVEAFEQKDVEEALKMLYEWFSELGESDHWKLSERKAVFMAKPGTQLLNSLWSALLLKLPGLIGQWSEKFPGFAAFLMAAAVVNVPMIKTQTKISRERRAAKRRDEIGGRGPQPVEVIPPKKEGMIWAHQPEP